jgi:acyl-CoA thioester hydrolase
MQRISSTLFDPRIYPFHAEIATRFGDLDPYKHINNIAMLTAIEEARMRFDASNENPILMSDARIVVAATQLEYSAEAYYPAPLDVYIGVEKIGKSSWHLVQLAVQSGQPKTVCRTVLVNTDGSGAAMPIDQSVREQLQLAMIKGNHI